jgi:hypothetical protein
MLIDTTCIKYGVFITCGLPCGTKELGWFRLIFTIFEEELTKGIWQLIKTLEELRVCAS